MRIIIYAISANTVGIATYTSNLIENIEAIIYVPRVFNADLFDSPNVTVKKVLVKRFYRPSCPLNMVFYTLPSTRFCWFRVRFI